MLGSSRISRLPRLGVVISLSLSALSCSSCRVSCRVFIRTVPVVLSHVLRSVFSSECASACVSLSLRRALLCITYVCRSGIRWSASVSLSVNPCVSLVLCANAPGSRQVARGCVDSQLWLILTDRMHRRGTMGMLPAAIQRENARVAATSCTSLVAVSQDRIRKAYLVANAIATQNAKHWRRSGLSCQAKIR